MHQRSSMVTIAAVLLLSAACGGSGSGSKTHVRGSVSVGFTSMYTAENACRAHYKPEIAGGSQVIVYGNKNDVLGTGVLNPGTIVQGTPMAPCILTFEFDVSGSSPTYAISFGSSPDKIPVDNISNVALTVG